MKTTELNNLVQSGAIVMVGIYWGGRLDPVTMRDQKTGQKREAHVARETVMGENDPVSVTRWLGDDEKPENWKPTAKKMDKVVIRIKSMSQERGGVVINGTIEKLEG